jgi:hypothetical protein
MNALPPHAETFKVAKDTLALSEKSGDRTLKLLGLAMLIVTGAATALHAGHALYRDLLGGKGRGQRARGEGPPPEPAHGASAPGAVTSADEDAKPQRQWTRTTGLTHRPREGEAPWAAQLHENHVYGRQR